jgi:hypothetical protein
VKVVSARLNPESVNLVWWPRHVQKALSNLGHVLGDAQLYPEDLERVNRDGLPGHKIGFQHKSGKQLGTRKGMYVLTISGPKFAGTWTFLSNHLEKLARAAAKAGEIGS